MQTVASNISVAEYCELIGDRKIIANPDYQRSDKIWPPLAQSFLIETILLDYPMPKIALNQILDLRSRQVIREIVDGQQRSRAISNFFQGELRLSRAIELDDARGRTFDELDDALKSAFLTYAISYDLFTNTTPDEVREVFRRINLYQVPLNAEEQRNAIYQGAFKVFIYHLSRLYSGPLQLMGVMTNRQIVRAQDAKLFTEIMHACLNGITTTNKGSLDRIYKQKDKEFPEEVELQDAFTYAIDRLLAMPEIHRTRLMRPYQFYSLALAVMHLYRPLAMLQRYFPLEFPIDFDQESAVRNLSVLAEALEVDEPPSSFMPFIDASASKTNVASQRISRFQWICTALSQPYI
jgi:hypothetical protein